MMTEEEKRVFKDFKSFMAIKDKSLTLRECLQNYVYYLSVHNELLEEKAETVYMYDDYERASTYGKIYAYNEVIDTLVDLLSSKGGTDE